MVVGRTSPAVMNLARDVACGDLMTTNPDRNIECRHHGCVVGLRGPATLPPRGDARLTLALQLGCEARRVDAIVRDAHSMPNDPRSTPAIMRLWLLRMICLLFVCGPAMVLQLHAQQGKPKCSLATDELRRIVLRDGSFGMIFPVEMLARGNEVLILGLGVTVDSAGKPITLVGDDSSLVGFLLTDRRRVATAIPAPHNMPTARYFRTRATAGGWESVFFVADRDTFPGARFLDAGTFWYARLRGRRWSNLERIGHVDSAVVARPGSSDLISRDGMLQFAVARGNPMATASTGSVMMFRRVRSGHWLVDTLPVRGPALSVSTAAPNASPSVAHFYPVVGVWGDDGWFPGSLLSVSTASPKSLSFIRRGILQSMNNPVELVVSDTMHTSWWEEAQNGAPPSIWYQALDPSRENDPAGRHLVVAGMTRFSFLAVPEDGRVRPVWAYQLPGMVDSAEVAVVANGEPVAVGRVAFPFGFMTNGVTSGDRSFILATMPRPISGEGPPASRTLEVRVDCRGVPRTSTGGTHETPVDDARPRRSAGGGRLHG